MRFLGLDRQRDRAVLTVHIRELRLDLLAHLDHRPRVLDSATRHFRCAQRTDNPVPEIDNRTSRIDLCHDALDDRILRMLSQPGREWVLFKLLDT